MQAAVPRVVLVRSVVQGMLICQKCGIPGKLNARAQKHKTQLENNFKAKQTQRHGSPADRRMRRLFASASELDFSALCAYGGLGPFLMNRYRLRLAQRQHLALTSASRFSCTSANHAACLSSVHARRHKACILGFCVLLVVFCICFGVFPRRHGVSIDFPNAAASGGSAGS